MKMMGKGKSKEGTAEAKSDSLLKGGPQEALIRCPYCVMSVYQIFFVWMPGGDQMDNRTILLHDAWLLQVNQKGLHFFFCWMMDGSLLFDI